MDEGIPFKQLLVTSIPSLRAYAISLTRSGAAADDLVQDTLVRAWEHQASFVPGTNFRAWAFTILRNKFFTDHRRGKKEVVCGDDFFTGHLFEKPNQIVALELEEFKLALMGLPIAFREALLLVGASGLSLQEASQICGVPEGTIKSRLSRARHALRDFALGEVGFLPTHSPVTSSLHHLG